MPVASTRPAGLGELSIAAGPEDILVAQGLGSCIGIAAYEHSKRLALLAHVMLPGPAPDAARPDQPARFADLAVQTIVDLIKQRGVSQRSLVVKVTGGAQVIKIVGAEDRLKIGQRNIAAVHAALARHGLRVTGEDTGGTSGRTLTLYAADGRTTVRAVGGTERPL